MIELIVDDRERHVIKFLDFGDVVIRVERITVGDYAIVYNGRIIAVIERKTLEDLAASIKDGRMNNNDKLMEIRARTGCEIIYIIEGNPFSSLKRKYGRIPFKALRGKIDSLRFRHKVSIIWVKDCADAAARIHGLCFTLTRMYDKDVFPNINIISNDDEKYMGIELKNGAADNITTVLKTRHDVPLDQIWIMMARCIRGITTNNVIPLLRTYSIQQLLLGQTDEKVLFNMTYSNGKFRFGSRGAILHAKLKRITDDEKIKVLTCINGITLDTAAKILKTVSFCDIVCNSFIDTAVSSVKKTEKRNVGVAIERRIRLVFEVKPDVKLDVNKK